MTVYMIITILNMFRAFRGQPRLAMVTNTIRMSVIDVFHFLIVFATVFFAFACLGMVLFGATVSGELHDIRGDADAEYVAGY